MNAWHSSFLMRAWKSVPGGKWLAMLAALGLACAGFETLRGQDDPKAPVATKKSETKAPDQAAVKAATEYVKKVHDALYARTSIRADIEQTVSMGNQQFFVTGQYVNSGQKLRLNYTIQPDQGVAGSLLEVCDGKELWSLIKVGDTTRVTHRDIQQIKAAVVTNKPTPEVLLTAELGLGGLTALMASLERTMTFDALKEESGDEGARTIVQGRWKPEIVARWPKGRDEQLPVYVPDMVRIWVDSETLFPGRITYIKRVQEKDKKVYRPMVTLKFRNVEFDAQIDEREFTFETPDKVVPEDITRLFLDRMKKSAEEGTADPAKSSLEPAPKP